MTFALLFSVFVIATCGLIYELIAGTLASYLLGDSVTQFSTIIGVYLFSMGIGSFLSRYVHRNLPAVFVQVELLVGVVGGCSAALLFLIFEHVTSFRIVLYSLVSLTGTLVGLEIPLLMRILRSRLEFKDLVSQVFTFDYIGALLASLLFPLLLLPHLGLVRSAFFFGAINVAVAIWTLHLFRKEVAWTGFLRTVAIGCLVGLVFGFIYSDRIVAFSEAANYHDKIVFAKTTRYQRIVLTQSGHDLKLFLNGNLQFSSRDEYRYHEALVHPALGFVADPKKVLVLGGGDGLAIRELLKVPGLEEVTLVELDPGMTDLFTKHPSLAALNENSFASSKVKLVHADAFIWVRENHGPYDLIVIDFPDPSNFSLGKLYTSTFFRNIYRLLAPEGVTVIQSTSPYVARKSFWCVDETLKSQGFETLPYHTFIPSFGEWGYILAAKKPLIPESVVIKPGLKFLDQKSWLTMTHFPADMARLETEVNRLNNQVLVRYFEKEWADYVD